jgi:hypothetical protein
LFHSHLVLDVSDGVNPQNHRGLFAAFLQPAQVHLLSSQPCSKCLAHLAKHQAGGDDRRGEIAKWIGHWIMDDVSSLGLVMSSAWWWFYFWVIFLDLPALAPGTSWNQLLERCQQRRCQQRRCQQRYTMVPPTLCIGHVQLHQSFFSKMNQSNKTSPTIVIPQKIYYWFLRLFPETPSTNIK